jgi:hypothetical protein
LFFCLPLSAPAVDNIKDLREIMENVAKAEHRSLSNFIVHAILTYLEDKHGIKYSAKRKSE